ncbi:MAG: hypothetical protein R6V47_07965 [Candidatus Delongbacteria bacterium]
MNIRTCIFAALSLAILLNAQIILKGTQDRKAFFRDGNQIPEEEVDGRVISYRDSVTVKGEYNYSKGDMDGLQKEYYPDGQISAQWHMKDGKRVGEGIEYYDDGTVAFRRELDENGNGLGIEYYSNGMKKRERLYKDGAQVHVSMYNHDIKGNKYERTPDQLFYEAQEYAGMGMYGHAVRSYKEFLKKTPDHKKAPDVKFLIAFTYHNSLSEEEAAKKHYEEFLEKYPDSPLAVSARYEMENMGKDLKDMELFESEGTTDE